MFTHYYLNISEVFEVVWREICDIIWIIFVKWTLVTINGGLNHLIEIISYINCLSSIILTIQISITTIGDVEYLELAKIYLNRFDLPINQTRDV